MAPAVFPCTRQSCAVNPTTNVSTVRVEPVEVPAGEPPSFTAPASSPAQGMIHRDREKGALTCRGYHPNDPDSVQFYLSGTTRSNITYRVTDTVSDANPDKLRFCLGATYKFTTLSGKTSATVMLPNGLSGFAGLVPPCSKVPKGPCLVSKSPAPAPESQDAVLKVLIPAIGGDPWGRA